MKLCVIISSLAFAATSVSAFPPSETPYEIYKLDNMKTCIWYSRDQLASFNHQVLSKDPKCLVTTKFELWGGFKVPKYKGYEYRADIDQCTPTDSHDEHNCIPFSSKEECKLLCGGK